jgi:uncharacterized membrane protein
MIGAFLERMPWLKIPILAILIFLIDIPWLYSVSGWSGEMIRDIQGSALEMKILPAAVVYLALAYLATIPKTHGEAFLLGSSVYAVYDFTNLATLKKYQIPFAIADTLWGGVLFTIVYAIQSRFL